MEADTIPIPIPTTFNIKLSNTDLDVLNTTKVFFPDNLFIKPKKNEPPKKTTPQSINPSFYPIKQVTTRPYYAMKFI
jgi:hypothetical protein